METSRERGLSGLDWVAVVLAVIGAINWGLVGLFNFNLVAAIFGGDLSTPSRIIYVLVALSGLYVLYVAARVDKRVDRRAQV